MTMPVDGKTVADPAGWDESYDLVVLGSGGAGLSAALAGAIEGMRVLLLEKDDRIGGTTALSSGSVWIPDNSYMRASGQKDDIPEALTYLDRLVGSRSDPLLREAYIRQGSQMLQYFEKHINLRWLMYEIQPDYEPGLPGAKKGRRALMPLSYDGRKLGARFNRVRWPLPELMLFGRMMVTRAEAASLLKIGKSLDSLILALRLGIRLICDLKRYKRSTRLVLGNALVARLFHHLLDRGVTIRYNVETKRIVSRNGRACGVEIAVSGRQRTISAKCGIILAGGGFVASPDLRERFLPRPVARHTSACAACTGDTLLLARQIGAALGHKNGDNALWFPASVKKRRDGSTAVYPHIVLDRAKPGLVAVNASGRRFTNEGIDYNKFVRAMYESHRRVPTIPAWLVCDRRFIWKYGLGLILPRTVFLGPFVRQGYLKAADTVEALARKIGVDPAGLIKTVEANNRFARNGVDTDFGKGSTVYDRSYGDPEHRPNPCLGPIDKAPFCAVKVVPTPLATSLGLKTDAQARVLNTDGAPITGLYACGNDMHNIFGGEYPGPGAQIGAGMVFGYIAAMHAAGKGTESVSIPSRP